MSGSRITRRTSAPGGPAGPGIPCEPATPTLPCAPDGPGMKLSLPRLPSKPGTPRPAGPCAPAAPGAPGRPGLPGGPGTMLSDPRGPGMLCIGAAIDGKRPVGKPVPAPVSIGAERGMRASVSRMTRSLSRERRRRSDVLTLPMLLARGSGHTDPSRDPPFERDVDRAGHPLAAPDARM